MRLLTKSIFSCLLFATFFGSKITLAANCKPNTSTTLKLVTDNSHTDHLYWVDTDTTHVCTLGGSGLIDLTNSLGLPLASSPVVGATLDSGNNRYVFYVDVNGHIQQVENDGAVGDLFAQGRVTLANAWPALAAYFSPQNGRLSVTYAVNAGSNVDKYGTKNTLSRYDLVPSTGSFANVSLYSSVGRGSEHMETQTNTGDDGTGRIYSTFDPEGQGHIHAISSNPSVSGGFANVDLMDASGVGEMDVTTGGGIIGNNIPTCQASGVVPLTFSGINFLFKGTDGDLHHLFGSGTGFSKRDITHESAGPLPDGCGNFAGNQVNSVMNLAYEAVVSGGRAIVQASVRPSQSWFFTTIVAPSGASVCNQINVLQHSPIQVSADVNGVNHYYYMDVNGHFFKDCNVLIN